MGYIKRPIKSQIEAAIERGKSVLLLGPRQTGKTTLIQKIPVNLYINLAVPAQRLQYERNPSLITGIVENLVEEMSSPVLIIIDEVQKVPILLDAAQDLIDRKLAKFILTGSSARKLRHTSQLNLLPGRVVALRMSPLTFEELPNTYTLEDLLLYGALPHIVLENNQEAREIDLDSYVTIYLEEEIRAEAIVRNIGAFARFLELAATESGNIVNFSKLSQEIGVAHTTITEYYQILEDCLVVERIEPLLKTKFRRRLTKSQKYIFFDLGIRRLSAREGRDIPEKYKGVLFEQLIGLELIRCSRLQPIRTKILFWRDSQGPEVDWVIQQEGLYIPIEVKWSTTATLQDAKHLQLFLKEYENTKNGYIVCRVEQKIKLAENIYALPWREVNRLILNKC